MKIAVFAATALLLAAKAIAAGTYVPDTWTLWLINWSPLTNAPAVVTPLATFPTGIACYTSIDTAIDEIKKSFANQAPNPGLMVCIAGSPAKH